MRKIVVLGNNISILQKLIVLIANDAIFGEDSFIFCSNAKAKNVLQQLEKKEISAVIVTGLETAITIGPGKNRVFFTGEETMDAAGLSRELNR